MVRDAVDVPLIAAGGIGDGRAMVAAMALGADGVQLGSRFVCTKESSAHDAFKQKVANTDEGDTVLTLKELAPVRLIKNAFYGDVQAAYARGASVEELKQVLGRARAKRGMFEGDMDQGELEIGQVSAAIDDIPSAAGVIERMMTDYRTGLDHMAGLSRFHG